MGLRAGTINVPPLKIMTVTRDNTWESFEVAFKHECTHGIEVLVAMAGSPLPSDAALTAAMSDLEIVPPETAHVNLWCMEMRGDIFGTELTAIERRRDVRNLCSMVINWHPAYHF
jgi:hypothetical protein